MQYDIESLLCCLNRYILNLHYGFDERIFYNYNSEYLKLVETELEAIYKTKNLFFSLLLLLKYIENEG